MLRPVITATALIALAGSSLAYAQHNFPGGGRLTDDQPRFEQRHRLSAADVSAFADARIAALKAGLQLTPDQAKNWPQFEQAVRDLVQLRIQRLQERQASDQQSPGTPFERLSQRADNMAKTSAAVARLKDSGGLFISVLADPTTGGVAASFAMLGDIIVAEPGALIGFAGPRTIWHTIKVELPEGFQRAEFLLEHGFVDMIVPRSDLRSELARLIDYCGK